MKKVILSIMLCCGVLLHGQTPKKFTNEQKREIEVIVHDYLINNPEILPEIVQSLQEKKLTEMQIKAVEVIKQNAAQIFASKSPYLGSKDGPVYIVEFLDYNCPHCRTMHSKMTDILADNKEVTLVIKEFPVLGDASVYAAKAALAAEKQGKFAEMHNALMSEKVLLTNSLVIEIARRVGLNIALLEQDMKLVEPELQEVKEIATKIGIQATPALILSVVRQVE